LTVSTQATCGRVENGAQIVDVVRRIQQNQIEGIDGWLRIQCGDYLCALNSIASLDAASRDVRRDQCRRLLVFLDEGDVRGSAAQCLDPHGACPRIAVQHPGALNTRRENVEEGFAQLVRSRSKTLPRRRLQPPSLKSACNDSHEPRSSLANFDQP